MEKNWTEEPIEFVDCASSGIGAGDDGGDYSIRKGPHIIAEVFCHVAHGVKMPARATAQRLAACYNACAGMEDPAGEIPIYIALSTLAEESFTPDLIANFKKQFLAKLAEHQAQHARTEAEWGE